MVIFILTAIAFRGANGIPGSVPVKVSHIFKNDFKDSNKVSNKSTVWLPKSKGSSASLSPKYNFLLW